MKITRCKSGELFRRKITAAVEHYSKFWIKISSAVQLIHVTSKFLNFSKLAKVFGNCFIMMYKIIQQVVWLCNRRFPSTISFRTSLSRAECPPWSSLSSWFVLPERHFPNHWFMARYDDTFLSHVSATLR